MSALFANPVHTINCDIMAYIPLQAKPCLTSVWAEVDRTAPSNSKGRRGISTADWYCGELLEIGSPTKASRSAT